MKISHLLAVLIADDVEYHSDRRCLTVLVGEAGGIAVFTVFERHQIVGAERDHSAVVLGEAPCFELVLGDAFILAFAAVRAYGRGVLVIFRLIACYLLAVFVEHLTASGFIGVRQLGQPTGLQVGKVHLIRSCRFIDGADKV